MRRKLTFFSIILLSLCLSADTTSLMLGEQYDFTLNGSKCVIALVGLAKDSATFAVSDKIASVSVGEMKSVDLNGDNASDVSIILDRISLGSTEFNITAAKSGEMACTQVNSSCSNFNECCAGNCVVGACRYTASINANPSVNISLDAPENVTFGSAVRLKTTGEDGNPVADVTVDIITPLQERLTLATNEDGEGLYIANQEGVYSYVVYNYLLNSSKTTLSARPAVPTPPAPPPEKPAEKPKEPFCGDGTCNTNENCSSCYTDCGACAQTPAEVPRPEEPAYSWVMWMGLMFMVIIIILRVVLPLFIGM